MHAIMFTQKSLMAVPGFMLALLWFVIRGERPRRPQPCVRIPLYGPFRLRIAVTARGPEGALSPKMSVTMNEHAKPSVTVAAN